MRRIGRYELQTLIGEGGMGSVYRGVDTKTGRAVALKVVNLPGDQELAEKLRQRFLREVLAVSRIGHPNVVRVDDYGFDVDNTPYLVMELLEGMDLGKVLRSSRSTLPMPYVADVVLEICAAVRACHAAKIIHRDLKPGNIFLAKTESEPGWRAKVLDFGVAKSAVFEGNLTNLGQIVGTLQYISPEQVNGAAGPESDQYAIGVILYACLTKRLPFGGLKDIALLKAISRGEFLPPRTHQPDIPETLERIVLRAMSAAPRDRFESVYVLGQQLWPFASDHGRRNWERFYAAEPVAVGAEGTTEMQLPMPPPASRAEGEPVRRPAEDATRAARYDATTVIGVDAMALIASVPTQELTVPTDDQDHRPGEGGKPAAITEAEIMSSASRPNLPRRLLVAAAVLAVLIVALAGFLRAHAGRARETLPPRALSPSEASSDAAHLGDQSKALEPSGGFRPDTPVPPPGNAAVVESKADDRSGVHPNRRRPAQRPLAAPIRPEPGLTAPPILP
jgi:hypothetical protein